MTKVILKALTRISVRSQPNNLSSELYKLNIGDTVEALVPDTDPVAYPEFIYYPIIKGGFIAVYSNISRIYLCEVVYD